MKNEAYIYHGKIKEIKIELVSSELTNEENNKVDVFGTLIKMEIDGDIKEFVCSYILSTEYLDKDCYALILNDNQFYMVINKQNLCKVSYFSYFERFKACLTRNYVLLFFTFLYVYNFPNPSNIFLMIVFAVFFTGFYLNENRQKNNRKNMYFKVVNKSLKELFLIKKRLK